MLLAFSNCPLKFQAQCHIKFVPSIDYLMWKTNETWKLTAVLKHVRMTVLVLKQQQQQQQN